MAPMAVDQTPATVAPARGPRGAVATCHVSNTAPAREVSHPTWRTAASSQPQSCTSSPGTCSNNVYQSGRDEPG
eukprot:scaffold4450_cov444-Prasinococcus_capsulatus_cf.AAC.2